MKQLRWILANGLLFAAFYFGLVENIKGALNLAMGMAWICIFFSFFSYSQTMLDYLAESKYPSVPYWLDCTYDFSLVGFLFWHGCWITAVGWIVNMISCGYAYSKVKEIRGRKATNESD